MRRPVAPSAPRAWSEAHRAWLAGTDAVDAGRGLPDRLALALRGIDALDRGDEAATRALLDEARRADVPGVAAALSIALASVEGSPLVPRPRTGSAVLDGLAGSVTGWLAGHSPRGSKDLVAQAKHRPLAESVRTLLAKRGSRRISLPGAIEDWPRAHALILALWGARLGGAEEAASIVNRRANARELLALARYRGLGGPSRRTSPRALASWLDGGPWSDRVSSALRTVIELLPSDAEPLLARSLDRLRAEIEGGRPATALEALSPLSTLACRLDRHDLEEDIFRLGVKLDWAAGGKASPELAGQLWELAQERGEGPRAMLILAELLLRAPPLDTDPSIVREAMVIVLQWSKDPRVRAGVLMTAPSLLSPTRVRGILEARTDLERAEGAWLLGLQGALSGDYPTALSQGLALLEDGARLDRACDLFIAAWGAASQRTAPRSLVAAARRSVDALAAAERVDLESAHRLARALGRLRRGLGKQRAAVRTVCLASIPDDVSPRDPESGHALAVYARLEALALARPLLREIGRALRSMAPAAADELALGTLARVLMWEDSPLEGDLGRVGQPLEAWLQQAGDERIVAAAEALAGRASPANAYAAAWLDDEVFAVDPDQARRLERALVQLGRGGTAAADGIRLDLLQRIVDERQLPF